MVRTRQLIITKKIYMQKFCSKCDSKKDLTEFYAGCFCCKACKKVLSKKNREENPDLYRKIDRDYRVSHRKQKRADASRYQKLHPERVAAWWKVHKAIREGNILRPNRCQDCGKKCGKIPGGSSEIIADHFKGYAKANQLDIEWICRKCDGKRRSERRQNGSAFL